MEKHTPNRLCSGPATTPALEVCARRYFFYDLLVSIFRYEGMVSIFGASKCCRCRALTFPRPVAVLLFFYA